MGPPGVFTHKAGNRSNFIFWDGHAKSLKWSQTIFPTNRNMWDLDPSQNPPNQVCATGYVTFQSDNDICPADR